MLAKLQQLPEIRDAASDQQALGLRAQLVLDRDAGFTPRDHAGLHRSDALRLVRPAADLDDVHAAESVSRDPRGRAAVSAIIRSTCATCSSGRASRRSVAGHEHRRGVGRSRSRHVRAIADRRRQRRRRHRRAPRRRRTRRHRLAAARPRHRRHFPTAIRRRWSALFRVETDDGPDHGESPGTVSGGDAVVQSGAGRVARRGGRRAVYKAKDELSMPASIQGAVPGRRRGASRTRSRNEPLLILAAVDHRLHRPRRALRATFIR